MEIVKVNKTKQLTNSKRCFNLINKKSLKMKAKDLLQVLINSSEKAANIARKCRSNQHLFSLLIEEKTGEDKVFKEKSV